MSKADAIEVEGIVTEILPNAMFKVKINGADREILAHLSGKMRMNYIKILVGDSVTVEMSPYDLTKGRITWRNKQPKDSKPVESQSSVGKDETGSDENKNDA